VDQRDALRAAIDGAASDLPTRTRDAALRRVEQLPGGASLCHGDLHPGNVILGNGRTVVIDWGNACRGNPVADVARSMYLMRDTPMREPGFLTPFVKALRGWFVTAYLAGYREIRPLDAAELLAWRLPILVARLAEGINEERDRLRSAIVRELAGAVR
jgi:Ser/Thr protein kinase RdoA (MazF antagonist)